MGRLCVDKRLNSEDRNFHKSGGDNTNYSMNFIPGMNKEILMKGYQSILTNIGILYR
ncbi:MAG: DUF4070 domain-containing protein [Bacteroidetes bacterium]|nr:DUF4070 domain-containing protein [Bacteroidota bacterium]